MASRDSGTVRPTKRMRVFFAAAVLLIVCVLTAGAVSAVEVETFTELKNAINFASAEDTIYIVGDITVPEDESLSISTSITLSPLTENVSISRGGAATANQNGMFTIWDGGSLTIQGFDSASTSSHTLTLDGKKDDYPNNEQTLVWINGGGSFTLKEGGILTNNSVTGTGGMVIQKAAVQCM